MVILPPFPSRNTVVEPSRILASLWRDWLSVLRDRANLSPVRVASVRAVAQSAAVAATTAYTVANSGLYRATWAARITQVATVSSSLAVTINWTDNAVVCSQTGSAMTGNLVTTQQSGQVVFYADAASVVTYSTAFASVGAQTMNYALSIVVEALP